MKSQILNNFLRTGFILAIISCTIIDAAKILGIFTFPNAEQYLMLSAITKELAKREHELTVVCTKSHGEPVHNYREIVIAIPEEQLEAATIECLTDLSPSYAINIWQSIGIEIVNKVLTDQRVIDLMQSPTEQFDLVLIQDTYVEALLAIADKFKAPIVTIGSKEHDIINGIPLWIQLLHPNLFLTSSRSIKDTVLYNWHSLIGKYKLDYKQWSIHQSIAETNLKYLNYPIRNLYDIKHNVSLHLTNSHPLLAIQQPISLNSFEISGAHIKGPEMIAEDVRDFLDAAKYGVVLVTLNPNFQSHSPQAFDLLINEFGKIKQRILMKWSGNTIDKIPSNIMMRRYFSQSDVLTHPHIKLFISHGDSIGIQESIYRGIPMLGIPLTLEQKFNVKLNSDSGCSLMLNEHNITEMSVKWALFEMLHNPDYVIRTRELSKVYRDRLYRPLEEATYWIRYVLKYSGAPHLRGLTAKIGGQPDYHVQSIVLFTLLALMVLGIILWTVAKSRWLKASNKILHKKL